MKKVLALSVLPLSMLIQSATLQAAQPGGYAGLGLGYSSLNVGDSYYNSQNPQFAGRGFAGYNFNKYFGVEGAYSNLNSTPFVTSSSYPYKSFDARLNALSFVAKGYLPLSRENCFNLYGLIGLAEMFTQYDVYYNNRHTLTLNDNGLAPTVGFGLSYKMNEKFTLGYEVSAFGEKESDMHRIGIPMSAIATLHLSYHF